MLIEAMLWGLLAGAAIPLGGWLAMREHIQPEWVETEIRHAVIAFAGGALIAAVTVVLVPLAEERLPGPALVTAFLAGGVAFSLLDRFVERAFGPEGQVVALVTDFLPEALALGTLFAAGERSKAILTAVILTSQNLPEAFNAWREMAGEGGMRGGRVLLLFAAIALLGPLAAFVGLTFLDDRPATLGAIAAFAAGGILYLVFQDVAPKAGLEHAWAPPLGAVAGYGIGFAGHLFVGG